MTALQGRYADGELDMLVTREPALLAADSAFVPLMEDECVIAARPGHPLAARRRLRAVHLRDCAWVVPPMHSETYNAFENLFGANDLPASQPLSAHSLSAVAHYVRESDALMMAPHSFIRGSLDAHWLVRMHCVFQQRLPPLGLTHRLGSRNRGAAALQEYLMQS
ncbi:LysR substrate-binding domain-containing protein [Achromobacter insuavis]